MEKPIHLKNRIFGIILFVAIGFFLSGCQDKCRQVRTYRTTKQKLISFKTLESAVANSTAELVNPGKIYIKDKYLFINEIKKGIHF